MLSVWSGCVFGAVVGVSGALAWLLVFVPHGPVSRSGVPLFAFFVAVGALVWVWISRLSLRKRLAVARSGDGVPLLRYPYYFSHVGMTAVAACVAVFHAFVLYGSGAFRPASLMMWAGFVPLFTLFLARPALWPVRRGISRLLRPPSRLWLVRHNLGPRLLGDAVAVLGVGMIANLLSLTFGAGIRHGVSASVAHYWLPAFAAVFGAWLAYGAWALRPVMDCLKQSCGEVVKHRVSPESAYKAAISFPFKAPLAGFPLVILAFGFSVYYPLYARRVITAEGFIVGQGSVLVICAWLTMYQILWLRRVMAAFVEHFATEIMKASTGPVRLGTSLGFLMTAGMFVVTLSAFVFVVYVLHLELPSIRSTGRPDYRLLIGLFIPFCVATMGVVALALREILSPIARLTRATQAIREGRLDTSVSIEETNEIGMLAHEFENMRVSLREKIARIESLNSVMEDKVRERTRELARKTEELAKALDDLGETQALAAHAEKMAALGQLAGGLAHEIKNPINYVYHNVTTLREYVRAMQKIIEATGALPLGPDERTALEKLKRDLDYESANQDMEAMMRDIFSGLERTRGIVENLRVFSRLERPEDRERFDPHDTLESALQILSPQLKNRIHVHRDYRAGKEIDASPGALTQVFLNLLQNAEQAIDGTGDIWIETAEDDRRFRATIRDSGKGIPVELQPKVFKPYFTTKDKSKGTGIGLAITKRILESQGGTVDFRSEPGAGTAFTVTIPKR